MGFVRKKQVPKYLDCMTIDHGFLVESGTGQLCCSGVGLCMVAFLENVFSTNVASFERYSSFFCLPYKKSESAAI